LSPFTGYASARLSKAFDDAGKATVFMRKISMAAAGLWSL
jgi:hypothetical protein